jgi:hypothetical protein
MDETATFENVTTIVYKRQMKKKQQKNSFLLLLLSTPWRAQNTLRAAYTVTQEEEEGASRLFHFGLLLLYSALAGWLIAFC